MTIERALQELRDAGFLRWRVEAFQSYDSSLPPCEEVRIIIWRRNQKGIIARGATLSAAMSQIRETADRPVLTEEESQLIIGAIPLQALPGRVK